MTYRSLFVSAVAAAVLAGCTTTGPTGETTQNRAGTGAIIGAVAGAIIGHNTGNGDRGRILGAAVGAGAGALIGKSMDDQERELKARLAEQDRQHQIEIERAREDVLKVTMSSEVVFDFGRAEIKPTFGKTLDNVADVLKRYSNSRIVVVGHTDSVGSDSYNQTLSEKRAAAVVAYLSSRGVAQSRLVAQGAGEKEPRASNDTEAGRQLNRRVELFIQPQG